MNGRIEAEYVLPPEGDNPQTEYLRNGEYEITGATLQYRDATGTFFLHIGTKADVESEMPDEGDSENSTVLGVDLGIEQLAVTSTGQFWSGDYLNHRRRGAVVGPNGVPAPSTTPASPFQHLIRDPLVLRP